MKRTLICLLPDCGSVCAVDIDSKQTVAELKNLIKQKKSKHIKCEAHELELYEARMRFRWLDWDDKEIESLEDDDLSENFWGRLVKMAPKLSIEDYFDGFQYMPDKVIHVLIRVPDEYMSSESSSSDSEESERNSDGDESEDEDGKDVKPSYDMSRITRSESHKLMTQLGIHLQTMTKLRTCGPSNTVQAFSWHSTNHDNQIDLCCAYLHDNLKNDLDALSLCVYNVENEKNLLGVKTNEFYLKGGADILIMHNQILEFPRDLRNLTEVKLLIDINTSDQVRDDVKILSKLIALDARCVDDPAFALYTNLSTQWDFFWISEAGGRRAILKAMYTNPTDGFEAIRALVRDMFADSVVEIPLIDNLKRVHKLVNLRKGSAFPLNFRPTKRRKIKEDHTEDDHTEEDHAEEERLSELKKVSCPEKENKTGMKDLSDPDVIYCMQFAAQRQARHGVC